MATHMRAAIQWQVGSMLPRDIMQITPCFRADPDILGTDPEWQTLADDLRDVIDVWGATSSYQIRVALYDIEDTVPGGDPNRPKAVSIKYAGAAAEANFPREVAVCLSFYGGANAPRQRGRLYIPAFMTANLAAGAPVRPSPTMRSKAGGLVTGFADLGGPNIDWIVWSPTNKAATKVTNWFVDDEYDVQRRRQLKPTTRTAGTTTA